MNVSEISSTCACVCVGGTVRARYVRNIIYKAHRDVQTWNSQTPTDGGTNWSSEAASIASVEKGGPRDRSVFYTNRRGGDCETHRRRANTARARTAQIIGAGFTAVFIGLLAVWRSPGPVQRTFVRVRVHAALTMCTGHVYYNIVRACTTRVCGAARARASNSGRETGKCCHAVKYGTAKRNVE